MRIIAIFKRLLKQEAGVILFFALLYLFPLLLYLVSRGMLVKNVVPFLELLPFAIYPVLFFIRGILVLKKEWDSGTIIHYKSSTLSPFDFEFAYLLYMLFEVAVLYWFPLIIFTFLSHIRGVFFEFTPEIGVFFFPLPLFLLSYLFGFSLLIMSKTIYRFRNTIVFLTGLALFILYAVVYIKIRAIVPEPFIFHVITQSEHIVKKGGWMFTYPMFSLLILFVLNLFLYRRTEY